jgi:hypothetical protein
MLGAGVCVAATGRLRSGSPTRPRLSSVIEENEPRSMSSTATLMSPPTTTSP